jgi:Spy/CpxP family protein refolding chaperone
MRSIRWITLGVLTVACVTFAEPSTQPATQPSKRATRLVQPWSKVTDLTEEQKEQLGTIHAEITDRINALRDEERERCLAVLTEEQKAALDATMAREAAERKAKSAEKRSSKAPTADKD